MRTFRVAIVLFFLSIAAQAQQNKEYVFTNISTSNGLASNIVTSIVQDHRGFMWLATINGLQRYDGTKFMTFKSIPNDNTTIPTNNLKLLFFDQRNRLWVVGHNNKVGQFNTSRFTFQEAPIHPSKKEKNYSYKHLMEAPDGRVILNEEKGNIYYFDEKVRQFLPEKNLIQLPPNWKQNRISWDRFSKRYWVATDSGLVVYNPASKKLSYRGHNAEQDPVIKRFENEKGILNVVITANNTIAFYAQVNAATLPLLYSYNRNTNQSAIVDPGAKMNLNYYELHGILQQRSGRIWIHGVYNFAQWFIDQQSFIPLPNSYKGEQSIKFNYANFSFEDREGNVWIATDNGLFLFNPDAQVFNSYNLIRTDEKNVVERGVLSMSVLQTKEEHLFIGAWGRGLFYFDKYFQPLAIPAPLRVLQGKSTVWDIHQHSLTGKLWFTLEGHGEHAALVYDPKTGRTEWVIHSIFGGEPIRQVVEDKEGNLWFGTQGGHLVKWDPKKAGGDINKGYTLVTQTGNIRKLYCDWQGFIWAATNSAGLLKVDPKISTVVKHFEEEGPKDYQLTTNELCDVLQYNDSTLIVAAGSVNLINLRTNRVTHLTTANGLPSNTAVSILKDSKGIIWFGMTSGLCRVNLERKIYTAYDRRDGIPYDNFEPGRALQLADKRLVFGTDQNMLVFDPLQAVQSDKPFPATPILTSFWLGNTMLNIDSIQQLQKVELRYNNSAIAIEFSNLNFLKQKKLRYYYKLSELDKDWIRAEATNHAYYNYIPPGSYTFHVKSMNEDGVSSKELATLQIVVKPPFWKTGIFYGLLTLLALLVLFLIDKERIKRLRMVQQMRSQIAGDLHKDIHVTLNDINVLSAMAKIKADKDLDRSKDYIDTISVKSRDMLESMEDILWTLAPENDSMEKMLLRIQEFTDGVRNTNKTVVEFNSSAAVSNLLLDMRCRHEFLLFYKHALTFVIQKASYPTIHIYLDYSNKKLILRIEAKTTALLEENRNALFSKEEMYKRAEALNAELDIVAEKQQIALLLQLEA